MMNIRLLPLIILIISFTSCATILSKKSYDVKVSSDLPNAKVKVYNRIYQLPAEVSLKRSNKNLDLTLIADSLERSYQVKPALSPTFLYLNILSLACPMGYAVDYTNHKRYTYGRSIYLNEQDTNKILSPRNKLGLDNFFNKSFSKNKGTLDFIISVPYINSFHFKPEGEGGKNMNGFLGFAIGLDYYYKNNQYFNLNVAHVINFMFLFPANIDYSGLIDFASSNYLSVSNNYKINRFNFGYGLSVAKNVWDLKYYDRFTNEPPSRMPVYKSHYTLGLYMPVSIQVGQNFYLGLTYRPTFYQLGQNPKFVYEHIISFNVTWKLNLLGK